MAELDTAGFRPDWEGVANLMFDSSGRLWVGRVGGGISLWDGDKWSFIRVSNSELPYSIVETGAELDPGIFWITASIPSSMRGVLSRCEGEQKHTLRAGFSGCPGAEMVTIAKDNSELYWLNTRTAGIKLY